jgi:hypothetical protein
MICAPSVSKFGLFMSANICKRMSCLFSQMTFVLEPPIPASHCGLEVAWFQEYDAS